MDSKIVTVILIEDTYVLKKKQYFVIKMLFLAKHR